MLAVLQASLPEKFTDHPLLQKISSHPIVSNPLNLLLLFLLLWVLLPLLVPVSPNSLRLTPTLQAARSSAFTADHSYSHLPAEHPDTVLWKRYTPRTLAVHDGSGLAGNKGSSSDPSSRILLAISGKVFDVTKGANFYGPGGPYGNFAGRDASRGMAKQSFDMEMLTPLDQPLDKLEDLTASEVNNMREWEGHFTGKYGIVGELVNEGEETEDVEYAEQ